MNFLTKEGVRVNVNKSELSNITHFSSQFVLRNVLYYSIRGWPTSHETWVFGMVDTSHQPALGYMEVVPQRRGGSRILVRGVLNCANFFLPLPLPLNHT